MTSQNPKNHDDEVDMPQITWMMRLTCQGLRTPVSQNIINKVSLHCGHDIGDIWGWLCDREEGTWAVSRRGAEWLCVTWVSAAAPGFSLISRWQVPIHEINFQFLTMLFVVNSRCESWVIHVNCYWIVTYEQYNYPIWGFMCGFSGYQALTYNEVQTRVCSLNRSEFNQDFSHEDEKNIYQQLYL